MNKVTLQKSEELSAVGIGIEILSNSANAQDLCRRIALADIMGGFCLGVAIYLLDQRSVLVEVASYGRNQDFGSGEITAWDDNLVSNAVRTRKLAFETIDDARLCALPIQHAGVTTGVIVFNLAKNTPEIVLPEEVTELLSSLGGLFMFKAGLSMRSNEVASFNSNDDEVSANELTTRQRKIIGHMADGLTNAEIAKIVLLSESTVRQETIRIFRTLKCHNRTEAVLKARAHGIIGPSPAETDLAS